MRSYIQPYRSRAIQAPLEPGFARHNIHQQEQLQKLSLLLLASFLLLSSPLSCEIRSAHAQPNRVDGATLNKLARYQAMLQLIDSFYVDRRNVSALLDSVMEAVMEQLDPHSFYMDKEETIESRAHYFDQGTKGTYGLELARIGKDVVVRTVRTGGPAERASIFPGDKVEKIWGQPVVGLTDDEMRTLLKSGSVLELVLSRKAGSTRLKKQITKNHMPERTVDFYEMLDAVTGYIYLSGFIMSTFGDLKTALKELEYHGMKKLVLDLRGNGGGLLDQAHMCAGLFLPKGAKLTAVKRRTDSVLSFDVVPEDGRYKDLEVIVLIDEETASAGEVLAGILQDHDRSLLLGEPSYGKGLVQHQYDLPDGGAFRITAARYYLPSGRCIQRQYEGGKYVGRRIQLVDGSNMDHRKDTLLLPLGRYQTGKGRTVYGGQGVIPEIVVNLDTVSSLIQTLAEADVFDLFLDEYLNYNAEVILTKHKTPQGFVKDYRIPKEIMPLFIKKAKQAGVSEAGKRIEREKHSLLAYIKRWMCYRLFPESGWIISRRPSDPQFQHALDALRDQLTLN